MRIKYLYMQRVKADSEKFGALGYGSASEA
jgi:hypothetical protein